MAHAARSWDELVVLTRIEPPYRRKPPYERSERTRTRLIVPIPDAPASRPTATRSSRCVAERYFELTTAAIKAADPNHLVLGCRFAYPAAGRGDRCRRAPCRCHLVQLLRPRCERRDRRLCRHRQALPDRRVLLSGRRFRPAQHQRRRTAGGDPGRARGRASGITSARPCKSRTLVGYHWFEHADQPAEGRFDGENSNFGTVTIDDRVYEELTRAMTVGQCRGRRAACRGDGATA